MSLQGIVLFLLVGIAMLFAALAAGLAAVFLVELWRFEEAQRRRTSPRSDFLTRLERGLAKKRIRDIRDVHAAYRAFFGIDVLRGSHLEEVGEFLQHAVRRIASDTQAPLPGSAQAEIEALQELVAANQRTLDVEHMCAPFSGTPEFERGLLAGLLEFPAAENATVTAKLDTLAKAIRFRQDALERLVHERGRSLKLARWGWYATLALALLSAILGFLCLGL